MRSVLLTTLVLLTTRVVRPDSDKIFVGWDAGSDDFLVFRRGVAADYWEGEDGS